MSYLTIKDLTKTYDGNHVLDHISIDLEKGMFMSLLGPSGCGKTTILRIIAGLTKSDGGMVTLNGSSIDHLPPNKRNMGIVFQSYALFPHMTVQQNIAYGLEQRKMDKNQIKKEVQEAIEMVQLTGFEHRKPKQLSGGQQQRVALARALVIKPELLLLDESLSALDKKLRMDMQVELRQIQKRVGITTIFVTHDQEEAMTMSDKIALMNKGKIVQVDTPKAIYEKPKNAFVANFLGQANSFIGMVKAKQGDQYTLSSLLNGQTLVVESAQNLEMGKKYMVIVRPEKIHLSSSKGENTQSGTIKFITYAGNMTEFRIDLCGHEFKVQQQNVSSDEDFDLNQKVWLSWDKLDTIVLDENGEKHV